MLTINLGSTLTFCPPEWVRFINELDELYGENKDGGHELEVINRELQPYEANLRIEQPFYNLDFQHESGYAAFVLRYGD